MQDNGISYTEGVRYFGNSREFYIRNLKRFPDDSSYAELCRALKQNNPNSAFLYAHTLKGLCSQLAIHALLPMLSNLCDMLRTGDEASISKAVDIMIDLDSAYKNVVLQIHELP